MQTPQHTHTCTRAYTCLPLNRRLKILFMKHYWDLELQANISEDRPAFRILIRYSSSKSRKSASIVFVAFSSSTLIYSLPLLHLVNCGTDMPRSWDSWYRRANITEICWDFSCFSGFVTVCKCSAIVSSRLYFLTPPAKCLLWDSTLSFIIMVCFPQWASYNMLEAVYHAQKCWQLVCVKENTMKRKSGGSSPVKNHSFTEIFFSFLEENKSWSRTHWLLSQIRFRIPGWCEVNYKSFAIFRI